MLAYVLAALTTFTVIVLVACGQGVGPATAMPLSICSVNYGWERPSEAEMSVSAWQDSRYSGLPLDQRREMLSQHFYRNNGSASLSGPWVLLSGLGQAPPTNTDECGSDWDRQRAAIGEVIEVWTLLYEPLRLERGTDGFVLHVRPLGRGFRAVQFGSREDYQLPVAIVDETGRLLTCLGGDATGGRCT